MILISLACVPPQPGATEAVWLTAGPFETQVTAASATVETRNLSVAIVPRAWGRRDEALEPIQLDPPVRIGQRAELAGGALTAWFESTEAGIQHGFDIDLLPPGDGWVELEVDLVSKVPGVVEGNAVWFADEAVYGGLVVEDATGRSLPAALSLSCGAACTATLAFDATDAQTPVLVDPWFVDPFGDHEEVTWTHQEPDEIDHLALGDGRLVANGERCTVFEGGPTWMQEAQTSQVRPPCQVAHGSLYEVLGSLLDVSPLEPGGRSDGVAAPWDIGSFDIDGDWLALRSVGNDVALYRWSGNFYELLVDEVTFVGGEAIAFEANTVYLRDPLEICSAALEWASFELRLGPWRCDPVPFHQAWDVEGYWLHIDDRVYREDGTGLVLDHDFASPSPLLRDVERFGPLVAIGGGGDVQLFERRGATWEERSVGSFETIPHGPVALDARTLAWVHTSNQITTAVVGCYGVDPPYPDGIDDDCDGFDIADNTTTRRQVWVTELDPGPGGFVEITSDELVPIDLRGATLHYPPHLTFTIREHIILPALGRIWLGREDGDHDGPDGRFGLPVLTGSPLSGPTALELRAADGVLLDVVPLDGDNLCGPSPTDYAAIALDPAVNSPLSAFRSDWCAILDAPGLGPTPGLPNRPCELQLVLDAMYQFDDGSTLHLDDIGVTMHCEGRFSTSNSGVGDTSLTTDSWRWTYDGTGVTYVATPPPLQCPASGTMTDLPAGVTSGTWTLDSCTRP